MAGRRICAGYYRRYDGKVVYAISLATNADTGEEMVIWTSYPFADVPRYCISSKKSFCAFVEVNGERKAKYKRLLNMRISAEAVERLEDEGFRGPVRKRHRRQPDEEYDSREYQQAITYLAYAKDLYENYNFDRSKYRLCVKEKRYAAITRKRLRQAERGYAISGQRHKNCIVRVQELFSRAVRGGPVHPQVRRGPLAQPGQRGLPAKEIFLCPGPSPERAGRGGGQVPSAETSAKLNRPNTKRSIC